MKASTLNLDLTKTEQESVSMFSKVPAGDYEVSLAYAQFKDGKNPGACGLQVGYMIESGEHKGKMVQDYINIQNPNEKAVEIGLKRIKTIMVLQGRKDFKLTTDIALISRNKFMVGIALEPNSYTKSNGDVVETENSVVKKMFAIEGVADIATIKETQAATKAKPAAKAAPTVVTPVAVDEEVSSGEDETPPWMRS